jgi:3-methyladenine DNA glycosylase Tag
VRYHDDEWDSPVTDNHRLFEKICREGFQAGLSWLTILCKRPQFRFMQAMGLVKDHLKGCARRIAVEAARSTCRFR